jgi:hypothetical protein
VSRRPTDILTPDATDKTGEVNPFDDAAATPSLKVSTRQEASLPSAALPVGPITPISPLPRHVQDSNEDVTALPTTQVLPQSPHLRTASLGRAPIPYNFHRQSSTHSGSQQGSEPVSRAVSPVSKRSARPYATLRRKTSDRSKRSYKGGAIHEEDIREMSAPMVIPQQNRDGVLQGDNKKLRTKDSSVTLPAEGSLRSSMTGWIEQRGWEVSNFAIINPRPLVRASGTMGFAPSSLPSEPPSGVLYRIDSIRAEGGKEPVQRDVTKTKKKYQPVGDDANELDASELRAILERDAKRRERREKYLAEKLDRKLQKQASQQRQEQTDATPRRREGDLTAEEIRTRVDEERSARVMTPPTDVHPALRSETSSYFAGSASADLSRGPVSPIEGFMPDSPTVPPRDLGIILDQPSTSEVRQNPFADQENEPDTDADNDDAFTLAPEEALEVPAGPSVAPSTARTSYEEAEIGTVQTLRMSLTATPPLSPVRSRVSAPNDPPARQSLAGTFEPSRLSEVLRQSSVTTDTARNSTYTATSSIQPTSPVKEKRSTPWTSFFRRGTTARKPSIVSKDIASDASFSNTSRDSLRAQSIPSHLADLPLPSVPRPAGSTRTMSGPPVRTQSRFREDLPELPNASPSISRTVTPDVIIPGTAAAVVAARKIHKSSDLGTDAPSGRPAAQQQPTEFDSSYEELGGIVDADAEYFRRNSGNHNRVSSLLASSSATPHREISRPVSPISDDGNADRPTTEPITSFGSVRRKATLVAGDVRVQRSREGLVSEYIDGNNNNTFSPQQQPKSSSATPNEVGGGVSPLLPSSSSTSKNPSPQIGSSTTTTTTSSEDQEQEQDVTPLPLVLESELRHAKSVSYTGGHSRQFSAGSARLLDVRRSAADPDRVGTEGDKREEGKEGSRPSTGGTVGGKEGEGK